MLRFFFELGDFLCNFIPGRKNREWMRKTQLYDYRKKLNSLKGAFPNLNFKRTKLVKGGWNIGFIVDKKYVFKIRKCYDNILATDKILREKRITDAFAKIVPVKIPSIEIIESSGYTFYRYEFIPGKNLNEFSGRAIRQHRATLGKKLGEFIYCMHNAYPESIQDLATPTEPGADGWNHHDICNNILVNPKSMEITGIIDWEYAGYGPLATEFKNTVRFKDKMKNSGIFDIIVSTYSSLVSKK